jgi:hypothetical protein
MRLFTDTKLNVNLNEIYLTSIITQHLWNGEHVGSERYTRAERSCWPSSPHPTSTRSRMRFMWCEAMYSRSGYWAGMMVFDASP